MAIPPRRITIELEPGRPITGTLASDAVDGKRPFTGWLSLLSALADAVEVDEPGAQAATGSGAAAGAGKGANCSVPSSIGP